jgi:hypothetical protein
MKVTGFEPLNHLLKLKRLDNRHRRQPDLPPSTFWKEYDAQREK